MSKKTTSKTAAADKGAGKETKVGQPAAEDTATPVEALLDGTDSTTQDEDHEVVSEMTSEEMFAEANANPNKGEPIPTKGSAHASASADNTKTEAEKKREALDSGRTSAETRAAAEAIRARAKANRLEHGEVEGGPTETPEQRHALAKEQQQAAKEERAKRKRGEEGSLETPDDLQERLVDVLGKMETLAAENTPAARKELRRLADRYGEVSQTPFRMPDKMPLETVEGYQMRTARLKRKHIRDRADENYLSAKAQGLLRNHTNRASQTQKVES